MPGVWFAAPAAWQPRQKKQKAAGFSGLFSRVQFFEHATPHEMREIALHFFPWDGKQWCGPESEVRYLGEPIPPICHEAENVFCW